MITFKKFLNEENKYYPEYDKDYTGFIPILIKDCKKYLTEIGDPTKVIAYRGYDKDGDHGVILKKTVRVLRKPRDTDRRLSEKVDNWFKKKFGIKFRSNSVYVVGNRRFAGTYGDVYVVFPIGDYDYCWSPKYSDFTEDFVRYVSKHEIFNPEEYSYLKREGYGFIHPKHLNEVMDIGDYQLNKGLETALHKYNQHEVMIKCKEYYMINAKYLGSEEEFLKKVKEAL